MRILFYLILMAGFGNTVLRPEIENPYTLYRFIAPIGFLIVFSFRPMMVVKSLGVFILFVAYNFALATAYSGDYSQLLPSLVHYFYLFILLVLVMGMKARYADFERQFIRFIQGFYLFLLANLFIELFIGSYYPNLYVDETDESSLRAFYWNQNDLAVVLCVVAWICLAFDRFKGQVRNIVVVLTLLILFYNDSKAALLSFVGISVPAFMSMRVVAKTRVSRGVWFVLFGSLGVLAVLVLMQVSTIDIQFANDTYSIEDLLIRPITGILQLESSGEAWGSLNNRMDAAVFVIIEYINSLGFGLGAGGSWLVLTLPQYELGGAQSPHNALLQFTVDFGYPVLVGYLVLLYGAVRKLFTPNLDENERLKVIAVLSFPLLGLSQSGAIVTNYFFFAAVYFIWLLGRDAPFAGPSRHQEPAGRLADESP